MYRCPAKLMKSQDPERMELRISVRIDMTNARRGKTRARERKEMRERSGNWKTWKK